MTIQKYPVIMPRKKKPMYGLPLIFVCCGLGGGVLGSGREFFYWGFGCWRFVIGVLSRDLIQIVDEITHWCPGGKQLLATTSMSAAVLCNQSKTRLRRHRMTSHLQLVPYPCLGLHVVVHLCMPILPINSSSPQCHDCFFPAFRERSLSKIWSPVHSLIMLPWYQCTLLF